MPAGKIFAQTSGLYIPPGQRFAVESNFYFCATYLCFKSVPHSNVVATTSNTIIYIDEQTKLKISEEERRLLLSRGISLQ